jgi:predicted DCC family thiol-disulfide oxidoreductase YuxK
MGVLSVYFDGACILCSREIEHYRKVDRAGALRLVDISDPQFRAETEGLDPVRVQKVMHVRREDGSFVTGVEAFREIWARIPRYRWAAGLSRLPGVRQGLDLGYFCFATVRPWLPKRKRDSAACESGVCQR